MTQPPFYIQPDDSPGKAKILQAGLRLFAERGLSATSIRDIAGVAKLSNPALYKHFKTKDALAQTLFERCYREIQRQLELAVAQATGFDEKFDCYVHTYLQILDDTPHVMLFTTENLPDLWPHMPRTMQQRTAITLLREVLELGHPTGNLAQDTDRELQLALILGTLGQITRQHHFRTLAGPAQRHAKGLLHLFRTGLSS